MHSTTWCAIIRHTVDQVRRSKKGIANTAKVNDYKRWELHVCNPVYSASCSLHHSPAWDHTEIQFYCCWDEPSIWSLIVDNRSLSLNELSGNVQNPSCDVSYSSICVLCLHVCSVFYREAESLSIPAPVQEASACLSPSLSLSASSCLPLPNPHIPCDRANPSIIYELLRLSGQWWQIPTGFNHGHTNEISMANVHGSPPPLLTALPQSQQALHTAAGYPGCVGRLQGG